LIGASQPIPPLKVDPASRINPVEASGFGALNTELNDSAAKRSASDALGAYEAMQKKEHGRRRVVKVSEVMTFPVISVVSNWSIEQAWLLMKKQQIKHLPVLDGERLVGICSQDDLLGRLILTKDGELEGVKPERIGDIMHTQVVTTVPETDIRRVAKVFDEYGIGALLVMSSQDVILGIVTKGDLIHRLAQEPPIELYV
jgi:acetoin utilization protein AcuB